jgi:hypothetical protein
LEAESLGESGERGDGSAFAGEEESDGGDGEVGGSGDFGEGFASGGGKESFREGGHGKVPLCKKSFWSGVDRKDFFLVSQGDEKGIFLFGVWSGKKSFWFGVKSLQGLIPQTGGERVRTVRGLENVSACGCLFSSMSMGNLFGGCGDVGEMGSAPWWG